MITCVVGYAIDPAQIDSAAVAERPRSVAQPLRVTDGPDLLSWTAVKPGPPLDPPVVTPPGPPLRGGGGGEGRLTQLGAGGEVSLPAISVPFTVPCVEVSTPTTMMSPAGTPSAFTVIEPLADRAPCTLISPCGETAGAGSEERLGHPGRTGTTTTLSPS